ncbi:L-lactate dehydrogenase [Dermabacter sp. p3-SID358]|uniref:L-lactate dehydrogenase n=1 Tax=Dermabacter sp. p3-SID358 TaxID=2916114 RepID=UPI0021A58077|nr:L-lactate dehydrogenase [Dermabacter sp. p3-SID358]MCT1865927.1 L-lactate dehydrogenase [Dermabacter sp. p3-SID358]
MSAQHVSGESSIRPTKIAVVGAGSVGSSVAYAAMLRGSAQTIALYDLSGEKAGAEALDIAHGSQFGSGANVIGGSDISCIAGADVVVITAGARQKPGQSRLDLADTNVRILRSLMPQLLEQAPEAMFMLVTNPCDVLTVAAQQATGLDSSRVFSSGTVLDSSRLKFLISKKIGVNPRSVHARIIGEHGDSEFAVWSNANVGGIPLREWRGSDGSLAFTEADLDAVRDEVANSAYAIIQGKGATNLAIGVSAARICEAILNDEKAVLTVSTVLDNYLGVSGVAMSVPSIVGRGGVERVLNIPLDEREAQQFRASAGQLSATQEKLGLELE